MTKQTEALRMAIEAMTSPNNLSFLMSITACKEALEQPTLTYEDGFAHGYEAHRAEQALEQPAQGEIVVTKNDAGQIVMVSRQDSEGNILSVIAESENT